jgi:gas vesicle protein
MDQGNELESVNLSNNPIASNSRFYIERQESLVTEKFSKNGRLMDLHLVAKNVAFSCHLVAQFDMNQIPPTAKLVYDWDDDATEEKEVEQLKTPPLEIITHVDRSGRKANVEVKISVLSSQHERAFFRIKFTAIDPAIGQSLTDFSQPIKVIAKRNQIRKMLEKKLQTHVKNESAAVNTPLGVVNLAQLAPKRERATQDAILESLHRIEDQQKEQFRYMQEIADKTIPSETTQPKASKDFDVAFKDFVGAWTKLPQEERPTKVRKLAASSEARGLEEFLKVYNLETRMPPLEDVSGSCTYCPSTDCPHKTELEMLNTLYSDFLKDPMSPEAD